MGFFKELSKCDYVFVFYITCDELNFYSKIMMACDLTLILLCGFFIKKIKQQKMYSNHCLARVKRFCASDFLWHSCGASWNQFRMKMNKHWNEWDLNRIVIKMKIFSRGSIKYSLNCVYTSSFKCDWKFPFL